MNQQLCFHYFTDVTCDASDLPFIQNAEVTINRHFNEINITTLDGVVEITVEDTQAIFQCHQNYSFGPFDDIRISCSFGQWNLNDNPGTAQFCIPKNLTGFMTICSEARELFAKPDDEIDYANAAITLQECSNGGFVIVFNSISFLYCYNENHNYL